MIRVGRDSASLSHPGRLAQLVEHLLYTQGVGGSIPSPPTHENPAQTGFSFSDKATAEGWAAGWAAFLRDALIADQPGRE